MADGADWAQLSDPVHSRLLFLLAPDGPPKPVGGAAAAKPPTPAAAGLPPAPPTAAAMANAAAPWMDEADCCASCGEKLMMDVVSALGQKWHPKCFVCAHCSLPFTDGAFMEHDKKPYHKHCYQELFAESCKSCGKVLDGKYVTANGAKYHKDCFVCAHCSCTLEGGFALSPDGQPFCAKHVAMAAKAKPKCAPHT